MCLDYNIFQIHQLFNKPKKAKIAYKCDRMKYLWCMNIFGCWVLWCMKFCVIFCVFVFWEVLYLVLCCAKLLK